MIWLMPLQNQAGYGLRADLEMIEEQCWETLVWPRMIAVEVIRNDNILDIILRQSWWDFLGKGNRM